MKGQRKNKQAQKQSKTDGKNIKIHKIIGKRIRRVGHNATIRESEQTNAKTGLTHTTNTGKKRIDGLEEKKIGNRLGT